MNRKQKDFIRKKLIPFIAREQGRGFVMSRWIVRQDEGTLFKMDGVERKVPACGTVACIGGSIEILTENAAYNCIEAAKFLGITFPQVHALFYGWDGEPNEDGYAWPVKFASDFARVRTPRGKASVAIRLLKEVIRTEGKCMGPR